MFATPVIIFMVLNLFFIFQYKKIKRPIAFFLKMLQKILASDLNLLVAGYWPLACQVPGRAASELSNHCNTRNTKTIRERLSLQQELEYTSIILLYFILFINLNVFLIGQSIKELNP